VSKSAVEAKEAVKSKKVKNKLPVVAAPAGSKLAKTEANRARRMARDAKRKAAVAAKKQRRVINTTNGEQHG
jgi:hypothetical protein